MFSYGYCEICHLAGPDASDEEGAGLAKDAATEAWNALPRKLPWTTETPTKDGNYWHRYGKNDTPVIWRVIDGCLLLNAPAIAPPLDNAGGEWAGPIPPPEDNE